MKCIYSTEGSEESISFIVLSIGRRRHCQLFCDRMYPGVHKVQVRIMNFVKSNVVFKV